MTKDDEFNNLIQQMKKHFLIILIASFSILHSQNDSEFLPLSKMKADEKIMYNLLKECTLKKSLKPNDVHFFPLYSIIENDKWLEFKTYIYDEPTYEICQLTSFRASYPVSVKFFKDNLDYSHTATENQYTDFSKKEYFMVVTEVPITENRKAWNYEKPKILASISSSKAIFDNRFNNAYFFKDQPINKIDKSIYKVQEHKYNKYFSTFAIIYNGNSYGVINKKSKTIIPFEYEYIGLSKFGLLARNKKQESFFIDLKNNIISKKYDAVKYPEMFCSYNKENNLLLVKKNNLYNILDNNFEEKLENYYNELIYNDKNSQILATINDTQVIINANTWKETNIKYNKINYIDKNTIIVEQDKKYGLLKTDGTILLNVVYDDISFSLDNYPELSFIVAKNSKFGFVNNEGKFVTEIKYDAINYLRDGYFEGKMENSVELFDKEGILKK